MFSEINRRAELCKVLPNCYNLQPITASDDATSSWRKCIQFSFPWGHVPRKHNNTPLFAA